MKIHHIEQSTTTSGRARLSARIEWEDCDRPAQDIYYEVAPEFAAALTYSANPFVVSSFLPAMRQGEKRLAVADEICPELRDGLDVAMAWLHQWHGDSRRPVPIEAPMQASAPPRPADRAAIFFTGGVDSMSTLRHNRLRYQPSHATSIKDGVLIFGLEVDLQPAFEAVVESLSVVADDAAMTLLPVYTNVRSLDLDWWFWEFEWEAAVYSSVAHALSNRLTSASISSTYDIPHMDLLGSHPLLDPNYSAATLRIRHDGITMSRLDKLRLISGWAMGLQRLRVCNRSEDYRERSINCGQCEKCVRTMLGLAALGVLDQTSAFLATDLTPEVVLAKTHIHSPYMEACYREMVAPLAAHQRQDLATSVEGVLERARGETGFQGSLRRLDRTVLGGRLRLAKRLLLSPQSVS